MIDQIETGGGELTDIDLEKVVGTTIKGSWPQCLIIVFIGGYSISTGHTVYINDTNANTDYCAIIPLDVSSDSSYRYIGVVGTNCKEEPVNISFWDRTGMAKTNPVSVDVSKPKITFAYLKKRIINTSLNFGTITS